MKRKQKTIVDIYLNKVSIFGCCCCKEDSNWCELYKWEKDLKKSMSMYPLATKSILYLSIYLSGLCSNL